MTGGTENRTVLLADDDPFILALYRGKLTQAGFAVEVARDGEEALRRLERNPPALLVLDLNMPRVDGVEVLRFIRKDSSQPDLPVIVLSNACTQEMFEAVRTLNPTRFLTKRETTPNHVVEEALGLLRRTAPTETSDPIVPPAPVGVPANFPETETVIASLIRTENAAERREALLDIYRRVQDEVRILRNAAPLTAAHQVGKAIEQFFEDLYARPLDLLPGSAPALVAWLRLLPRHLDEGNKETADAQPVLVFSEDGEQRRRLYTLADRPGFQPLAARREATGFEMMEENPIGLLVWHTPKASAMRSVWRRLRESAADRSAGILFVLPAERMDRAEKETLDHRAALIATPVLDSEFRLRLYELREGAAPASSASSPGA